MHIHVPLFHHGHHALGKKWTLKWVASQRSGGAKKKYFLNFKNKIKLYIY